MEGVSIDKGTSIWAAFVYMYPENHAKRGSQPMLRIPRALLGWSKLCPQKIRDPLFEEGVSSIAVELARTGHEEEEALMTVLILDT